MGTLALAWLLLPGLAFGVGFALRRWTALGVAAIACIGLSALGAALGWFADEDTPSLGGAIVWTLVFEFPPLFGLGLGTWTARELANRR